MLGEELSYLPHVDANFINILGSEIWGATTSIWESLGLIKLFIPYKHAITCDSHYFYSAYLIQCLEHTFCQVNEQI